MSGHSKWANIKHRKGKQDAKRGKVFTRIAKEITIAAREGGGDITANPRLRLAVLNGKAVNMPGENITRAIKKGTGEIEGVHYEEGTYEGYAPLGVAVIIETVTDNKKRTVSEIRAIMGKLGGSLGEPNSVAWSFDRKGAISFKTNGKSEDELMETTLEAGGDDLEYDDDTSRIICEMTSFAQVNSYLMDKGYEITESKLEYMPQNTVNITDLTDAKRIMKFIDAVEDQDDVQNIYSNFEIDDSIVDQLED